MASNDHTAHPPSLSSSPPRPTTAPPSSLHRLEQKQRIFHQALVCTLGLTTLTAFLGVYQSLMSLHYPPNTTTPPPKFHTILQQLMTDHNPASSDLRVPSSTSSASLMDSNPPRTSSSTPTDPSILPTITTTIPPPALRARHRRPSSSPRQSSSWFEECLPMSTTVWQEWQACLTTHFATNQGEHTIGFQQLITTPRARRLWATSNHTAVLLEFRAWERELSFSINNVLTNLPVHWRIQIVGGPDIIALAQQLFPAEIQAGKVELTNLGYNKMKQVQVSRVLTDIGFYQQLLGDTWLFFQYDSAICTPQRHLLASFLEQKYGWWGAPWRHWNRLPNFGGNGGFSLRRRAFVTTILTLFPWVNQMESDNEDWFMINRAADLYQSSSSSAAQALHRNAPYLLPAPRFKAMQFSVETVFYEKPFGVHQFWRDLYVPNATQLISFFNNCPEAWELLPENVLDKRWEWMSVICAEKEVSEEKRRYWNECVKRGRGRRWSGQRERVR